VTFRALLLVLYGTGIRLGEALGLRIADVDLAQDLIRIRETKFYKTRLVPIGGDVHRVIEKYLSSLNRKKRADSPLFQSKKRERIKAAIAERTFKRLRKMCGIRRARILFRFNPASMIFATRSQFTGSPTGTGREQTSKSSFLLCPPIWGMFRWNQPNVT